ncbi:NACHT, LRR and PYD domains-containing protein 4C-like [Dysidea avara]|uniref:NACHT, LRR and PYD domains-containing protein 4C-like n=1 Tax=Dysidea avara TaxID=196820 RepID=UPI00332098D9
MAVSRSVYLKNSNCFNFLGLRYCHFGATGFDKIGEILQSNESITSVNLSCTFIEDKGIDRLVHFLSITNKIQDLNLCYNSITVAGVHHLIRLMGTLTRIDLSINPLKDEGVSVLLSSLIATMKHIGLRRVEMTSSSCHIIADTLQKVNSISFTLPKGDCKVIYDSLVNTIRLSDIEIEIEDLSMNEDILSVIAQNPHIGSLTLSYGENIMWVEGTIKTWITGVTNLLEHTVSLTELSIIGYDDENYLFDDILVLADGVKKNKSVKILKYSDNSMTVDIMLKFLERLTEACTLEEVAVTVCVDPDDYHDCQCLATVEKNVRQINNNRKLNGMSALYVIINEDLSY